MTPGTTLSTLACAPDWQALTVMGPLRHLGDILGREFLDESQIAALAESGVLR